MPDARVPTSPTPSREGWSVETVLDHVLSLHNAHRMATAELVNEKVKHLQFIIEQNDKRYAERAEAQHILLDTVKEASERAITLGLSSAKEAVAKAEVATERRFEGVNEFRASLSDQQRTFMPRSESENRMQSLSDRIEKMSVELASLRTSIELSRAERRAGSSGNREGWMWAAGAIGLVLTVLSIVSVLIVLYSRKP